MQARFATNEQITRNVDPYYRFFQKKMYGGREWMNIILAIGTIDHVILAKMNAITQMRTEDAARNPLPQRRDHHLPKDERAPRDKQGIDHKTSEGKRLRAHAKKLDKDIAKADADWYAGRGSQYTRRQWQALLDEGDAAWDEAVCSTPTTVPLPQRRAATDAMALASTQGLGGYRIFPF